jgi:hypothetical protein
VYLSGIFSFSPEDEMRLRQAKVDEDGKKEERRKDRQERMPEYVWKVRGVTTRATDVPPKLQLSIRYRVWSTSMRPKESW